MSEFDDAMEKITSKADELKNQTSSDYQKIKEKHLKKLKSDQEKGEL